MKHALENIRILDLSRVLAGPCCTQILGDLGADIIKIERPHQGDDTRKWGPPFLKDDSGSDTEESAYYLSANRNKRSVAVDITTEEGQDIIHKLLEKSDVLIENFKVGNLAKYGLSYEDIKARHPHIIYCSITGFGQNGALASEPGYDFLAQAMGGLMAITGEKDGAPMKAGVALSDVMTGHYAAIGILAALQSRAQTGTGQHIDLSLLDCTLAGMTNIAQYYLTAGKPAPRQGNAHSTIVPYQAFATKDGHIIIAVGNDRQFTRFCDHIGQSAWAQDARFATNQKRVANRDILLPEIEAIIAQKESATWLAGLREADVPCGPVNDMAQAFAEPQVQERDMQIQMKHSATSEDIDLVGSPLKLSNTPVSYRHAPPTNGQHTDTLLKELLGMDEDNIDMLRKKDVIA
jgi:crotonobetainyl-CoA:carnitine CoA-transferase CaiB-like acyl-CoA transferase